MGKQKKAEVLVFYLWTPSSDIFQVAWGGLQDYCFPGDCCEQVCICSIETEIPSLYIYEKSRDIHTNYKSKWYLHQLSLGYLKKRKNPPKTPTKRMHKQKLLNLSCLFNWQIHSKNLSSCNALSIPLKVVVMPYDMRHHLGQYSNSNTFLSLLALIRASCLRLCLNKNGIYCIHE